MADKQYGLSEQEMKIIQDQAARRAINRKEFLKQSTNPHLHATGHAGYVFDPAIQRFLSMKVTQYDHFRPTPTTAKYGLMYAVLPIGLYAYALWYERKCREEKYSTGQVAYRDRNFKLA